MVNTSSGDGKAMMLPSKHAEEKYSSTMIIKFLEEQGLTGAGDGNNLGVYIQCDPESAIAALRKIVLDKVKGARPREAPKDSHESQGMVERFLQTTQACRGLGRQRLKSSTTFTSPQSTS